MSSIHTQPSQTMLVISNDGPAIRRTNYWTDKFANSGKFVVSLNIDLRILLPGAREPMLKEMATAKEIIISRGPWPMINGHGIEILFEDHSPAPYSMHTGPGAIVGILPRPGDSFLVTIWTKGAGDTAVQRLARPGRYRHVRQLPSLKAWTSEDTKSLY